MPRQRLRGGLHRHHEPPARQRGRRRRQVPGGWLPRAAEDGHARGTDVPARDVAPAADGEAAALRAACWRPSSSAPARGCWSMSAPPRRWWSTPPGAATAGGLTHRPAGRGGPPDHAAGSAGRRMDQPPGPRHRPRHRSSSFCHDNRHLPDRPDHRPAHQGRRTPFLWRGRYRRRAAALPRHPAGRTAAPDAVVATGDLVDFGSEEEYRFLRGLLAALPMPVYLLPGNHDSRAMLRRVFPDHAYLFSGGASDEPVHYAVDAGPLRTVGFDCTVPGRSGGLRRRPACGGWMPRWPRRRPRRPADAAPPALPHRHRPHGRAGAGGAADWRQWCAATPGGARAVRPPAPPHRAPLRRHPAMTARTGPPVALDLDPQAPSRFRMEPPGYLLHWWHARHGWSPMPPPAATTGRPIPSTMRTAG